VNLLDLKYLMKVSSYLQLTIGVLVLYDSEQSPGEITITITNPKTHHQYMEMAINFRQNLLSERTLLVPLTPQKWLEIGDSFLKHFNLQLCIMFALKYLFIVIDEFFLHMHVYHILIKHFKYYSIIQVLNMVNLHQVCV